MSETVLIVDDNDMVRMLVCLTTSALWFFRALLLIPFVLMGPEVVSAVAGRGTLNVGTSEADVLGTSALLILVMMLAVTPVETITGWRWHIPLRRDYGLGLFAVATADLISAAATTGDRFKGGLLNRVGGHSFLVAGTLATLLLVPLALTAHRRAQLWLGGHWKSLHRLVYVVWAVVLLHLLLLFGLRRGVFADAVAVSVPLAAMRIPALRRSWAAGRVAHRHRLGRGLLAVALTAVFLLGYVPLVRELVVKGVAAFNQHPSG